MRPILAILLTTAALVTTLGCERPSAAPTAAAPVAETASRPAQASDPQAAWWRSLSELCGLAFGGSLVEHDEADAELVGQRLVMHVRTCDDTRITIPFHIGDERSRTWVLTRSDAGIHLGHDHRHQDGSPDEITLYGGGTATPGTTTLQEFPADDYSKELFVAQGIPQSSDNVWSMEIVPGERFSYALRRTNRSFRVAFDLTRPVEPPPAPWGHG